MTDSLDLLDFAALTPESLETACRDAMAACDRSLEGIVALDDGERTFANTMLALEEAVEPVSFAAGAHAFMAYVSADDAVREKAREMEQALEQYLVGLSFREDLYGAVKACAETTGEALEGEDARYLAFELRDYRRNGFELDEATRGRVREVFDRLVELGTEFRNAIDDWDDGLELTRDDLDGLPESFVAGLKRVDAGGAAERFRVSLDYPELMPFLANARSPALRRQLFEKNERKGGLENVARLEEAIRLRAEAARLLGYESWADYAVEPRMAATRATVDAFLADIRASVAAKAEADFAGMRAAKSAASEEPLAIWDMRYYHNERMMNDFAVDEFRVAEYFPRQAVLDGLFDVTGSLLGVRFDDAPDAPRWHPDVRAFDVRDADGGEPFARFYMDLFPRPNKYGHAAAFTLRRGRELADGSFQRPVSAIVANFTKPTETQPSLLRHQEVVVLFHEFGHILHQTLTRARRGRFSGTATERDFVEAPSQMLEHWCWQPNVLQGFARHYETGEPIPPDLVAALIAAKNLDSGVFTLRQLYYATLDWAYHSPGFDGDTTAKAAALHEIQGFPFTPGTHFQSGFGHLFGYDAGYYGYLWSQVFGDDMYTRFEGARDTTGVGREYRSTVLERGGSVDGAEMVRRFLGREPNAEAFLRGLGFAG